MKFDFEKLLTSQKLFFQNCQMDSEFQASSHRDFPVKQGSRSDRSIPRQKAIKEHHREY